MGTLHTIQIERSVSFDDFWEAYPKHVSKKDAKKAWDQTVVTVQIYVQIMDTLAWQVKTWTDPRYIPLAATWLRGERWEDEPDPVMAIASCEWSGCKGTGTTPYGTRMYCERHIQAFNRGETPT